MNNLLQTSVSLYNNVKDNKGSKTDIASIIHQVAHGGTQKNKLQIETLRATSDPKKRDELKRALPAVTWSGEFSQRKADQLVSYSGLICLDLDKLEPKELTQIKKKLTRDPFTFFLFISPSGSGLKVIFKVRGGAELHLENFLAIEVYFKAQYGQQIDKSGKDINRLCFLSYDPQAWFQVDSQIFEPTNPGKAKKSIKVLLDPDRAYNIHKDIWDQLAAFTNKKLQFQPGNRNNWIHLFACNANRKGYQETETLDFILANYTDPEVDPAEIKATVHSAFKNYQDHGKYKKLIDHKAQPGSKPGTLPDAPGRIPAPPGGDSNLDLGKDSPAELQQISEQDFALHYQFFDLKFERPKDEEDSTKRIRDIPINYVKFLSILEHLGFRRLDIDNVRYLIHIQKNIIREVDATAVMDAFLNHMRKLPDTIRVSDMILHKNFILNKLLKNLNIYFNKDLLFQLKLCVDVNMNADSREDAYFYYANKCARVTKDGIELLDYSDLKDKVIWDNSILPRDIQLAENTEVEENIWGQFLFNACGQDKERMVSLMTILGYMMHKYYEGKMKAIIFTDSKISDNPEGRTGKGLIFKGIGHMLNKNPDLDRVFCEINGKQFNPDNERRYELVEINSKLLHIDDVKANYNVESHYNEITNGIIVNKKFRLPFTIHVKIGISTNRTLKIEGSSSMDRFIVFDLADYYNDKFSPENEFGKWFFRDYSEQEWNLFDTFMLNCVQWYLGSGILLAKNLNLNKRVLHDQVGEELVNFLSDFPNGHLEEGWGGEFGIIPERLYVKKDLYELFIRQTGADSKRFSQRNFTYKLRQFKKYHESWVMDVQTGQQGDWHQEKRSNGKDMIWFVAAPVPVPDPDPILELKNE